MDGLGSRRSSMMPADSGLSFTSFTSKKSSEGRRLSSIERANSGKSFCFTIYPL